MGFILYIVVLTDVFLLNRTVDLLDWCIGWLSWTQKQIERGLIAAYLLINIAVGIGREPRWLAVTCIFSCCFIGFCIYINHREPDKVRSARLTDWRFSVMRLYTVVLFSFFAYASISQAPRQKSDFGMMAGNILYIVILYVTSIPSFGEPGKKRKMALSKVKEMFGTDWAIAPEPQPQ